MWFFFRWPAEALDATLAAHGATEVTLSPVTEEPGHGICRDTTEPSQDHQTEMEELADLMPMHPVTRQTANSMG